MMTRLGCASSARLHPLPGVKEAWIPLHNAQVSLCAKSVLWFVRSAPGFSAEKERERNSQPLLLPSKCYLKQALIHVFSADVREEKRRTH